MEVGNGGTTAEKQQQSGEQVKKYAVKLCHSDVYSGPELEGTGRNKQAIERWCRCGKEGRSKDGLTN